MITAQKLHEAFLGDDVPEDEDVDKWLDDRKDHIETESFHDFWLLMVHHHGFVIATVMLASFQITYDLMVKEFHLPQNNIEI